MTVRIAKVRADRNSIYLQKDTLSSLDSRLFPFDRLAGRQKSIVYEILKLASRQNGYDTFENCVQDFKSP